MTLVRHVAPLALVAVVAVVGACSSGPAASTASPTTTVGPGGSSASPTGSGASNTCPTSQPPALPSGETRTVSIETPKGTIRIKVEGKLSPIAACNFVALAACGFYDNVVFHRVVPTFVIQGGDGEFGRVGAIDPQRVGTGGPGYTIQDEPVTSTYSRGTVAMARSAQPNSVGSQFFIVLTDSARTALADPRYNNYQIVGSVASGMEAADAIAAAADAELPSSPIPMTRVTVANP
jgi:cyclophilin family peptidyl-prolyl cis-trans isomerase